jgi:hypothetical protein
MGCNCNKRSSVNSMESLARGDGGYLELTNDDNGFAYAGQYAGNQVFIVAKLTEAERLFRHDQLVEASAYAREIGKPVVGPPAGLLPDAAVRKLYDEAPLEVSA